ncbi:dTDP-4-dehydrorhamnose reductase [Halobacteriovorax sp. GB3]|uniref:dTDP-4-dehydrorhamnose reductase n=1 Tax=Halobacteriovorax sp. GB3 TaxID=2719615 RepID=UPI002360F73A|nr:dTDP-4-dehydrorhamnose reductase [Halobacteriovorax sp. GB3]MDD0852487.1 dTDP-4-dehydrorhamnose reductase [Halobacteriovorax sp. GB3]
MIFVTGGNGQLGKSLKKVESEIQTFSSSECDITSYESVHKALENSKEGDFLINCAAYTAVDLAEEDQDNAFLVNRDSLAILSKICQEKDLNLIHISTDYVFDGNNHRPYKESDSVSPQSVYGASKKEGEESLIQSSFKNYSIVRTSWVYSEYGKNFVKTMMALSKKEELSVVFDQVGSPTYATDLAEFLIRMTNEFEKCRGEIFHFSNEGVLSWYDFAVEIMEELKSKCTIHPIESHQFPTKAKRPHYSVLNKSKIKKTLNYNVPYWKEGLRKCLKNLS